MYQETRIHPDAVGFVVKYHQPDAAEVAQKLGRRLVNCGKRVFFASESKEIARDLVEELRTDPKGLSQKVKVVDKPKLVEQCDLIIVVGGDDRRAVCDDGRRRSTCHAAATGRTAPRDYGTATLVGAHGRDRRARDGRLDRGAARVASRLAR